MNKTIKFKIINKNDIFKTTIAINNLAHTNLLQLLQTNKIPITPLCQGNGTCGKCKVKFVNVAAPITDYDLNLLSQAELTDGVRLACKCNLNDLYKTILEKDLIKKELIIETMDYTEENIAVENIKYNSNANTILENATHTSVFSKNYFLAIDIGTTTIAMALVDSKTGEVCNTYSSLNHQRKYGADVISRILASTSGKQEELKQLIESDLVAGISEFGNISISRIIIAGNTTMIHLLMGYSCEGLGKFPFNSEHLEQIECSLSDCISTLPIQNTEFSSAYAINMATPVTILPSISAFVGGDIVAGLMACDLFQTEELNLLIDLGTNGEMVLGNKQRVLVTSTAAGPAFEGGNIVCGTASIPGSISMVKIQNQRTILKTIQNKMPPIGICGTGLLSVVTELLKNKLIDRDGLLKPPYYHHGFPLWTFENGEKISLYQKDIREFQMAKSAIRAGIDILLKEFPCTESQIEHVYIAGGFGTNLSKTDALTTGLLPKEFDKKITTIGNGCMAGLVKYGISQSNSKLNTNTISSSNNQNIQNLMKRTKTIYLSENNLFQELYLKYMNFE